MGGSKREEVAVVLAFVSVLLLSQLGGGGRGIAEAWKWPEWVRCFPGCLLGESCLVRAYKLCRGNYKWANFYKCTHMATWWCDRTFFHTVHIVNQRRDPKDHCFGDGPPKGKGE